MYIFDENLGLYINQSILKPLLISGHVLRAAREADPTFPLKWDDQGYVCGVSHEFAQKLMAKLGITMLSALRHLYTINIW
jgi:hypothetical protein